MDATPSAEQWDYSYAELRRLLSSANSLDTSSSRSFTYSNVGSIRAKSTVGSYTYPSQGPTAVRPHAPTAINGSGRSYDANGNLTSGAGATLTEACPRT